MYLANFVVTKFVRRRGPKGLGLNLCVSPLTYRVPGFRKEQEVGSEAKFGTEVKKRKEEERREAEREEREENEPQEVD